MCIRDRLQIEFYDFSDEAEQMMDGDVAYRLIVSADNKLRFCLLYTSDAADERSSVDLGGRRIIKKKIRIEYGCSSGTTDNNEKTNTRKLENEY